MLTGRARQALFAPLGVARRIIKRVLRMPEGRRSRWLVVFLLSLYGLVGLMLPTGDSLSMSAAEAASARYRYGLLSFELSNFMDKWFHRVYTAMPWTDTSVADRQAELQRYLELVPLIADAQLRILQASSGLAPDSSEIAMRQRELDRLLAERDRLRDGVEEYLESAISTELRKQGLGLTGEMVWPPVDFRIDSPPSVLVISPRDHIERIETVLIDPGIPAAEMERIEQELLEENNVSAAIMPTGGLASYPNVIRSDMDLLPLLEVAAHEWVHAYLFFHPLGRSFFSGGEMVTINETLADIVGDEVGGEVWATLTGNPAPVRQPPPPVDQGPVEPVHGQFDFFTFMRETRVRADALLAGGDIAGAEAWMESRRMELQDRGYLIRKINQAFFAFNGSYGNSPGSVSPIARQLWDIRAQVDGPGEMLQTLNGVSSLAEFKALLKERGIKVD